MSIPKTSEAKLFTARINPKTSPEEKAVLKIIRNKQKQSFNFKQIAVDAILRAEGYTPEMFAQNTDAQASQIADEVSLKLGKTFEKLLSGFAQHIIDELRKSGVNLPYEANVDTEKGETISPFAMNFARGYIEREKQGIAQIDDDEDQTLLVRGEYARYWNVDCNLGIQLDLCSTIYSSWTSYYEKQEFKAITQIANPQSNSIL